MELILISLLLIFTFGFVGLITLGYIISLWEKQKLDIFSKSNRSEPNNNSNNVNFGKLSRHSFSTFEVNSNPKNMKIPPQINEYFERSIVVVKNQDYKGWLDKTTVIIKKVSSNLELHFRFGLNKLINLITKDKAVVESNTSTDVSKTIDKINKISQQDNNSTQQHNLNNNLDYLSPEPSSSLGNNSNHKDNFGQSDNHNQYNQFTNSQGSIDVVHNPKSSFATLDLASEEAIKTQKSKDEVYEKIENSILDKLKIAGLSHYDIWLELGKHYEKYNEREKAIEIYSMVMKHSEGRNKDIARDGLIALS